MSSPLYAALDIGGTKTLAVLFDAEGRVFSVRRTAGITPVDAPLERCLAVYAEAVRGICAAAGERPIRSLYASVATHEHYTEPMNRAFREAATAELVRVEPDGMCLISGMLGHRDGAALICGTGSSLYVRTGDSYYRIGGWGHYIDSCGSGFVLGRLAIRAALRAHDGREEPTLLSELTEQKAGRPIWEDYDRIYALGRPYVARFADCVFEARRQGDRAAIAVFNECAADLANLIVTARRREGRPLGTVFNGGIFMHHKEYAEAVRALAPADTPVIFGDTEPVYGCAVEALYTAGLAPAPGFREAFNSCPEVSG